MKEKLLACLFKELKLRFNSLNKQYLSPYWREIPPNGKPQVDDCLHHLFEAQADKTPSAPAILQKRGSANDDRGAILTYQEVEARSNQLAHYLRHRGVVCNNRVGLLIPRSPELYIAILAILKAGGADVTLDPEYPDDRIDYILSDCGIETILTTEDLAQETAISVADAICDLRR